MERRVLRKGMSHGSTSRHSFCEGEGEEDNPIGFSRSHRPKLRKTGTTMVGVGEEERIRGKQQWQIGLGRMRRGH